MNYDLLNSIVCTVFNISNIKDKTRKHPYPDAKKVFCYVAYVTQKSKNKLDIARYIGTDHATVIYHIDKAEDFKNIEQVFNEKINKCSIMYNELLDQVNEKEKIIKNYCDKLVKKTLEELLITLNNG